MNTKDHEILLLACFIPAKYKMVVEKYLLRNEDSFVIYDLQTISAICKRIFKNELTKNILANEFSDLKSLAPFLIKHEKIIEQIMQISPIFPVQFGMLFSSLLTLEQTILDYYQLIDQALQKQANQSEWAVKGYLEINCAIDKFTEINLATQPLQLETLSPGAHYLKLQHTRNEVKNQLDYYLKPICESILNELNYLAKDFIERELLLDHSTEIGISLFNWAFLVGNGEIKKLKDEFNAIQNIYNTYGLHFSLTGPWPPYSFCKLKRSSPILP